MFRITIKDRRIEGLGKASDEDIRKEGYNSKEEFVQAWKAVYGRYEPRINVVVYTFSLDPVYRAIGKTQMEKYLEQESPYEQPRA